FTHFWNVSKACAEYLERKYDIPKMSIVHPFFDTNSIKKYQIDLSKCKRDGILLLARRGKEYIPTIKNIYKKDIKITILYPPYHEEEFFELLLKHKFFVSVDSGVDNVVS